MEREEWFFIYAVIFLIAASFLMGPLVIEHVEEVVLSEGIIVRSLTSLLLKNFILAALFSTAGFPFAMAVFDPDNLAEKFFTSVTLTSVFIGFIVFFGSLRSQGFRYFVFNFRTLIFSLSAFGLSGLLFRRISGGAGDDQ